MGASVSVEKTPRVGLWGTFDVDNYGDLLLAQIERAELAARLPGAEVRAYSPFGWFHPVGFEAVDLPHPLGAWSPTRVAELAEELDCVVIGGGDLIHDDVDVLAHAYGVEPDAFRRRDPSRFFIDGLGARLERDRPVIWSAVGVPADLSGDVAARVRSGARTRAVRTVRDDLSRSRLRSAGVEGDIQVVPDPGILVSRLFPPEHLEPALDRLVRMDRFPPAGPAVVVQGNGLLLPWAPRLAETIRRVFEGASVVTLEIGPCHGDGKFAHAMHAALDGSMAAYHVPGTARLGDLAAAVHGADALIGSSLHGSITAVAYGRPYAMLHGVELSKMDGFAALVGGEDQIARAPEEIPEVLGRMRAPDLETVRTLQDQVDAHLDRVARIAEGAAGLASGGAKAESAIEGRVLARALRERERRLVIERDSLLARIGRDHDGSASTDEVRLARALSRAGVVTPVQYLSETGSTNARALERAREGAPEWTVVVTGHQTAGRGRLGRRWLDVPGSSLLCSVVLRPRLDPGQVHLVTLAAAVAMIDAASLPTMAAKWPNDLVVGDRKCGGILAEADVQGGAIRHLVLGIGVNVTASEDDLPEEIRAVATSLAIEGASIARDDLLARFLAELRSRLESPGFPRGVVDAYRSRCRTIGRRVRAATISGDRVQGRAVDIDDLGGLVIERAGRVERVAFGEVEHLT